MLIYHFKKKKLILNFLYIMDLIPLKHATYKDTCIYKWIHVRYVLTNIESLCLSTSKRKPERHNIMTRHGWYMQELNTKNIQNMQLTNIDNIGYSSEVDRNYQRNIFSVLLVWPRLILWRNILPTITQYFNHHTKYDLVCNTPI